MAQRSHQRRGSPLIVIVVIRMTLTITCAVSKKAHLVVANEDVWVSDEAVRNHR
jgi:hypothetical protein